MSGLDLPTDVSPNGQEIWDWAGRFSSYVHLKDEARSLSRQIGEIKTQCGSCAFWMTRKCPKEKSDMSGYSKGPSCNEFKCAQFAMKDSSTALLAQWETKLADTHAKLDQFEKVSP